MKKSNLKFKAITLVVAATLALGGCTTMEPGGQSQTNVAATAGVGAGIGALMGGLMGGKRGALIGAALGGGAGYLVGTDKRKKELEAAKVAASQIQVETGLQPVVYAQQYQNVSSGEKAEGLKCVDVPLPLGQMTNKKTGVLTEKGAEALVKLQAVADQTGEMEILVPANLKATTFASITKTAPRAKVKIGDDDKVIARINARPLDPNGGLRIVAAN
jgi:hypothetical protein